MRKNLFNKIKAGGKGGKPGQWSARKAQMLAKEYKEKGGGWQMYNLKKPQRSLKKWTKQKWRTKSGKPSIKAQKPLESVTCLEGHKVVVFQRVCRNNS